MRIRHLFCLLLISSVTLAQKTESFYDIYWKPCPSDNADYYTTIEKTDSGWLKNNYYIRAERLQMRALYEDAACTIPNGKMAVYHSSGVPSSIGKMVHGKQEGVWLSFHHNGMLADSAFYKNGEIVDKRIRWYNSGFMSDSISKVNDSMFINFGWFEDGSIAFAGYTLHGNYQGKWKFYHRNGQIATEEVYKAGKLVTAIYKDEDGSDGNDDEDADSDAQFKGGDKAWITYVESKLLWPVGTHFNTTGGVNIGVSFAIDEEGNVIDAYISLPFNKEFDAIALDAIKKSPRWQPARSHNRKIKSWRTQAVTFVQQ